MSRVTWIRLTVAALAAVALAFGRGTWRGDPHRAVPLASPGGATTIEAIPGPTADLEGGETAPPMRVTISAPQTESPPRARPHAPPHRAAPKPSSAPVSRSGLAAQPPRAGPPQDASLSAGGPGGAGSETAQKGAERAAGPASGAGGGAGNETGGAGPSPAAGASGIPGAIAQPAMPPHIPRLVPPSVITQAGTEYPADAFRLTVRRQDLGTMFAFDGAEGTVGVRALVLADGTVAKVDVPDTSGSAVLDRAAAEAVRRWRFLPATRDGVPIDAYVTLRIRYVVR